MMRVCKNESRAQEDGPLAANGPNELLFLVVLEGELELANRVVYGSECVRAMSAEIMRCSLKLSSRFLQLFDCTADVRMALASSIAVVVLRCW